MSKETKLTSSIINNIEERPLQTMTIDYNEESKEKYDKLPKSVIYTRDYLKIQLPDTFDGRVIWKGLLTEPKDQKNCGACWAFATTSTLADKLNIQSLGLLNANLSAAQLVLCDFGSKDELTPEEQKKISESGGQFKFINEISNDKLACNGNTLMDAYQYLFTIGTPDTDCVPYTDKISTFPDQDSKQLPLCSDITGDTSDLCTSKTTPARFFRAYGAYTVQGSTRNGGTESMIRNNIYQWGPVSSAIKVYPDFYTFNAKDDIYEWNEYGPQVGGHGIEIVGWGSTDKKNYWIVKNSWGKDWGDEGYFKIVRGVDNCGIESNVITCIPDFFFPMKQEGFVFGQEMVDAKVLEEMYKNRQLLNDNINQRAGGISPDTGYSRRALKEFPNLDPNPPLAVHDWPNYATFIAGIDADVTDKNGKAYKNIQARQESGGGLWYMLLWLFVLVVVVVVVVMIIRKFR